MWHYTINTADTFNFSRKPFDTHLRSAVQPLVKLASSDCITIQPLPEPFNAFSILLIASRGFANFNIYCKGELVSVNTACWSKSKHQLLWETVEEQYLELTQKYGRLTVHTPMRPTVFPWLTTLATSNPNIFVRWLNDFKQCLALALVNAEQLNSG